MIYSYSSSQFPANDWKDENDCKYKNGTDGHPYWKEREEIIANKINLIKSTFQEECNKNEKVIAVCIEFSK